MLEQLVVADDLSGAAESAATFLLRTTRISVLLTSNGFHLRDHSGEPARVVVLDTDSRHLEAATAGDAVARCVAQALAGADGVRVVKKVDSLLRGNVAAEVRALAALLGATPVVAIALPSAGRTVVDGVPLVDGRPLADTTLWGAEEGDAPLTVADVLVGLEAVTVPLSVVRDAAQLRAALADAQRRGAAPVCDAETEADLDAVVAASTVLETPLLVGSAALVAAVARLFRPDDAAAQPQVSPPSEPEQLVVAVVGSAAPTIAAQVALLEDRGLPILRLDPRQLLTAPSQARSRVEQALTDPGLVVALDQTTDVDPSAARRLSAALAFATQPATGRATVLLASGGETAHAVLTVIGVDRLTPVATSDAVVRSHTPDGVVVLTRPGSHGSTTSLLDALAPFLDAHTPTTSTAEPDQGATMTDLPRIAVTMGDAAGIGPEVIVRALLDPECAGRSNCVVVGDAARLRRAAELVGLQPDIVTVTDVSECEFVPGRINVIDLGLIPEDLPFGTLSAVAGDAAYHYVRVASELAMAHEVQAICTAPLNKEALHAGGHIFPGHTELLAKLTDTTEVSMMLATPRVRVIHVTTHIGLIDAVERIEPGLVERTIRRGHQALVDAGVSEPKIGVCGINPHAGEGGLFGRGEEEEKIAPGVKAAQADGIDVVGPLPADTLFFLAGRGDYDLVVAMYHDQGHGPVKILGLEAGVNITVGLPVIRTSVDHGTAFDIAGKGIADHRSMVEALRLAAEMAPTPTAV